MPLLVMSGRPCVGKTTLATALKTYFETVHKDKQAPGGVVLLNDETLGISKKEGYKNAASEKIARGTLKGAVERACNGSTTVIVDSLNYIKGYRYELYCSVRSAASTHAVVHVGANTPEEEALEWNRKRRGAEAEEGKGEADDKKAGDAYDDAVLSDLWTRYETPDEKNRWDSPLFTCGEDVIFELVQAAEKRRAECSDSEGASGAGSSEVASSGAGSAEPPTAASGHPPEVETFFAAIAAALYNKSGLKPVASTILTPTAPPSYLHELDRLTGGITNHLISMLPLSVVGDVLQVPGSSVPCVIHKKVPPLELRRLKRLFDKNAATRPGSVPLENVPRSFVEFINANLKG